jgi:hypothetical protein
MYKVWNGSAWVDICTCDLKVLDNTNNWVAVNPLTCTVRFWTGTEWCLVECIIPI